MNRTFFACLTALPLFAAPAFAAGSADLLETDERFARLHVPGGLTSVQVSERTRATSPAIRGKQHAVAGADAKLSEARANFVPKLTGSARYTRLSPVTMPPLSLGGGGSGSLVVSNVAVTSARPYNAATDSLSAAAAVRSNPVGAHAANVLSIGSLGETWTAAKAAATSKASPGSIALPST